MILVVDQPDHAARFDSCRLEAKTAAIDLLLQEQTAPSATHTRSGSQ
jgi:hypothetical protein